jgi:hypothetical protein
LAIPEAIGIAMAVVDDPLDADAITLVEDRGQFLGKAAG